ncbi:hypothetical protein SAMN05421770_101816 [Granulicella rosea]|uniref:Zinc-finger n=1 Tax=Granulicella rosea TaxID=474952 RepID=A0A239E6L8_9BACT|nr:zf-HC2 domain-containing protein [Granulicella rosea]SNS40081.1 hypothetical protein SAMN05421770_101816 [Granulicella rosea]
MNTKSATCKTIQDAMPDLLLDPSAKANATLLAHIDTCSPCKVEYTELRNTFAMLDEWTAPEPSPYFDQRLAVLLREEQAAPKRNWFERLQDRILFNTGRQFRPAVAGVLALALAVSGGGLAGYRNYVGQIGNTQAEASDAVNELQILDRNDKAFQQMDLLLQDEDASGPDDTPTTAPPTS